MVQHTAYTPVMWKGDILCSEVKLNIFIFTDPVFFSKVEGVDVPAM